MAESPLLKAERMVEQLSVQEQAKLLASLALRMAQAMEGASPDAMMPEEEDAWDAFFRAGEALSRQDGLEVPTVTSDVATMRR